MIRGRYFATGFELPITAALPGRETLKFCQVHKRSRPGSPSFQCSESTGHWVCCSAIPRYTLSGFFFLGGALGRLLAEKQETPPPPGEFCSSVAVAGPRHATRQAMEPVAPFHRLAYSHAVTGLALVFPSWLVHGVAPHRGSRDRAPRISRISRDPHDGQACASLACFRRVFFFLGGGGWLESCLKVKAYCDGFSDDSLF